MRANAPPDDDEPDPGVVFRLRLPETPAARPNSMFPPHTPVWSETTEYFEIDIIDLPGEGRALFLDSMLQSTAASEAVYHRALIQPALEALGPGGPRSVLILGAGECASVRDVLRAPSVQRVVAVDIDAKLIAAVREYMPQWHAGSLDDPRVELRIEDARDTLAHATENAFDLVVLDLTDPPDVELGPIDVAPALDPSLLGAVRRVLRPGGVLTAQIGERDPPPAAGVISPLPALRHVFDHVTVSSVFVPAFYGYWSFALAE
jgi:spermidine synthase